MSATETMLLRRPRKMAHQLRKSISFRLELFTGVLNCAVCILAGVLWQAEQISLVQFYVPAHATDDLRTVWQPHVPAKFTLLQLDELNDSAHVVLFRQTEDGTVWLLCWKKRTFLKLRWKNGKLHPEAYKKLANL